MTEKVDVEQIVRIHSGEGPYLEVGTWAEAPSCIEIRAGGDEHESYYGKLSLVLTPGRALALSAALRHVAESIK